MAITKTVTVRLEVLVAPDFFPSVNPTDLVVFKGDLARYICSLMVTDTFSGVVRLTCNLPGASFNPPQIEYGVVSELIIDTSVLETGVKNLEITFEEI